MCPRTRARSLSSAAATSSSSSSVFLGRLPLPEERRHPSTDLRTQGIKHVAYAVRDLRALMDELKEKGVDVVWDVVLHDNTLCAFVRDNSGNLVEFVER